MQIWPRNKWRMCCSLKLDKILDRILSIENCCWSSTQAVFVKNYEIRFFRFDYMYILKYLYRVSFLTTLDKYKDYFKSYHKWCKVLQKNNPCILWPETKIALVHHILCKSYCVFTPRVLWPKSFMIFIVGWIEELCSQQSSSCWCVSHVLGFVHWTKRLPLQYKSNWGLG